MGRLAVAAVMLLMLVYRGQGGGGGGGSHRGGVGGENNSPKVEHGKQEGCGQDPSAAAVQSARLFPQSLMCGHTALCAMR